MKSLKTLLVLVAFNSAYAFAVEPTPYFKVGVGAIINATDDIDASVDGSSYPLYGDSKFNYHIEMGISVPANTSDEFRLGLYWTDLIQQKEYRNVHRPYKLEVFSDYIFKFENNYFFKVGAGFKVLQDDEIKYTVNKEEYTYRFPSYLDKVTARLAVGKTFGNYELSVEHHSHWLKGKPINNEWEYQATTFTINYKF